jgi:hypothetical protein
MRTPGKRCIVADGWEEKLSDCKPGSHADIHIYIGKQQYTSIAGKRTAVEAALPKPCRQEADELDAEGEAALAQLRQAARQLLGMVSLTSGPAAAARLADVSFLLCCSMSGSDVTVCGSASNSLRSGIRCHHRMSSRR